MKYVDLHCDTLTACFDGGYVPSNCNLQINIEKLNKAECAAQCFAIFTQGECAALSFDKYLNFYKQTLLKCGVMPVKNSKDLTICLNENKLGAILTVENLGFIGSDLSKLEALKKAGVRMASLVWNYENKLAFPNLVFKGGAPAISMREQRGLKPLGKQAVEILDGLKIIIDVSHLSDGGTDEILNDRKIPVVASHSGAASVCDVSRNLTDLQIKKIADCGGVIGINFYKKFLGGGDSFERIADHISHIINTGGEDSVSFGSDFDGIPPTPKIESCLKMPLLLEFLENRITSSQSEKLCFRNFARVFKEVCG